MKFDALFRIEKRSVDPAASPLTEFNHFSLPSFDEGMTPALQLGSEIMSSKNVINKPCILLSKLNPRIRRVWRVKQPPQNAICSTEFLQLVPLRMDDFDFVYAVLLSRDFQQHLEMRATGTSTSHQRVKPEYVESFEIANFSSEQRRRIGEIIAALDDKIECNRRINQTLEGMAQALYKHWFVELGPFRRG